MYLIHSESRAAAYNLALEEFLLEPAWGDKSLLLFYENEEAVVLGKNQNFLAEVNQHAFYQNQSVSIERRVSGGGTVFHGKGNLNFAFIRPHKDNLVNNFKAFNRPVVDALNALGIPAAMNQRNDILCKGFKISGNAQFTNRKRMISHGTLLISAQLDTLSAFLKPNPFELETRSIASVRSKVANINAFSEKPVSSETVMEAVVNQISKHEAIERLEVSSEMDRDIQARVESKFSTWDWKFARASKASILYEHGNEIRVEQGHLQCPSDLEVDGFKLGTKRKQPEEIPGLLKKLFFKV